MAGARRWLRIAASALGGVLFGLLIGGAVAVVVATNFFGWKILTVQTGSMAPSLYPGDLVVVRPSDIKDVKEGDVVLYQNQQDHVQVVHRVIGIHRFITNYHDANTDKIVGTTTDIRLITKGDHNGFKDDQETDATTYRGTMWFSIPRLGATAQGGLQTFLFILAAMIAVAWVSWEVYRRVGKRAEK